MTELKNTPWRAVLNPLWQDKLIGACYYVEDSEGQVIAINLDKETAKAIASLPETLKRLEELEAEASDTLS